MTSSGRLTLTTPSDREVRLTRVLDAPRARVLDAWTEPALLRRWFGPRGWTLAVCGVDLRVGGGAWRSVLRGPDGRQMTMYGLYREIAPPSRLVHTEMYGGCDGESIVTGELVEHEPMDHGVMFGRSFSDLDGHIWEIIWMDPNPVQK